MVFTSRIEIFGVQPYFRFSFIINSFHHDLFSKGISCISGRHIIAFSEEPVTSYQVPGTMYQVFPRNDIQILNNQVHAITHRDFCYGFRMRTYWK